MNKKKWAYTVLRIGMKILDLPDLEIAFVDKSYFKTPEISAMLDRKSNTIIVNEDWLVTASHLEISVTIFHETRHSYQLAQTMFKEFVKNRESKERVDRWQKEFDTYVTPTGDVDDLPYLGQDIEIDAIAFSNLMTKTLFDTYLFIPDSIKERVCERMDEIRERLIQMGTYQLLKRGDKE